jgi:hypothetical protein
MKKTLRRLAPVALILLGFATLSFMAKGGITLRLKPQQGKTYTLSTKSNTMMMMDVQGQTMNQSQSMEFHQTFTPKNVTDKESMIETQVEAIKMTVSVMGQKLEYDSENPEKTSPMLASQTKDFEASLKKPATVTYDALGNVIDSLNLDMSQLGAAILQFPEKELSVGSQWTSNKDQSVSGTEISVDYTYTVTAISKKSVDLNIAGTVKGSTDDISGNYQGTASINPQTGLVMNSTMKSNMSMTISEQGLSIPVTMVVNTTVEVK